MSLHVELSPEAAERLHKQQRNSTVSSIIIAGLTVTLITLLLGWFLLPVVVMDVADITVTSPIPEKPEEPRPPQMPTLKPKPSSPSPSLAKVLVVNAMSPTSVPVPDIDVTTPTLEFGNGNDFGTGWDQGIGKGSAFGDIPRDLQKRCSKEDRLARLQETGGTPECEDAVVKSLRWLKKTQKEDGSWDSQHPVAMTGFAILAFLGHCETPQSEEFGDAVSRGIAYLVDIGLKNDGRISNKDAGSIQWVYDHGIATYALAESHTFCSKLNIPFPNLDTVTKKAGDLIMKGQGESGGWVYKFAPTNDGDNSVGFWQIQALKACKHTGLWSDSKFTKVSRKALDWLDKAQGKDGSIGYRGNSNTSPGLTGGGVLAFQMWGKGSSKNARDGIKYISKNTSFKWGTEGANLYYHYYNAQAMINDGGKDWNNYNKLFRDELLKNQNEDGSWTQAGVKHGPVNVHMATCLATLMLEVYYRFLPGTGADSH